MVAFQYGQVLANLVHVVRVNVDGQHLGCVAGLRQPGAVRTNRHRVADSGGAIRSTVALRRARACHARGDQVAGGIQRAGRGELAPLLQLARTISPARRHNHHLRARGSHSHEVAGEADVVAGGQAHAHATDVDDYPALTRLDGIGLAVAEGIVGMNLVVVRHVVRSGDQQGVVHAAELVGLRGVAGLFLHQLPARGAVDRVGRGEHADDGGGAVLLGRVDNRLGKRPVQRLGDGIQPPAIEGEHGRLGENDQVGTVCRAGRDVLQDASQVGFHVRFGLHLDDSDTHTVHPSDIADIAPPFHKGISLALWIKRSYPQPRRIFLF